MEVYGKRLIYPIYCISEKIVLQMGRILAVRSPSKIR
jgi:hypothetical protein